MATLLVNSTSVGPHNFFPNFLVFNGFNKKYASNRLFPFAGELSSEKFGITLRDVQQMSQIFKQIQEITRQRNLRKLPQLDKYMKKIKKGDFCLVMKKSLGEDGCRAGHKLRSRFYDTPCIIYKRYKSSCLLLPYSPAVLEPTRIKRQGKTFTRKLILVNFERIKKIPCPLKLLNLSELKSTFDIIADILLTSHDTPIVSLINPDFTGDKQKRTLFLS
jgi:hypothetical protein